MIHSRGIDCVSKSLALRGAGDDRLAKAVYCVDRKGAGNDLELGLGPEHAVVIAMFRSTA